MFTSLFACCSLCREEEDEQSTSCYQDRHHAEDEEDDDEYLSDDEVAHLMMNAASRRKKTYGTRASKTSTRAHGIFGNAADPSRSPLDEITNSLGNILLNDASSHDGDLELPLDRSSENARSRKPVSQAKEASDESDFSDEIDDLSTVIQAQLLSSVLDPVAEAVKPLQDVYQEDRGNDMMIMTWEEVLTGTTTIEKIAEASFAQVFRVTNEEGSSILKFIELKTPYDPASMNSETAACVETVVPEFRMMNALAEVPGFLNFKDAHIVMGKPPVMIQRAYDAFVTTQQKKNEDFESWFPSPNTYTDTAVFLALELGDAGTVLEDIEKGIKHNGCTIKGLGHVEWVWDILLGVIIALSRAEQLYMFEHRDLHENNICVKLNKATHVFADNENDDDEPKLGRSGIEVTILDYGLSRATLGGVEVFADLESDLEIFQSESQNRVKREDLQYDTYRRMRNHLFSGKYHLTKSAWHGEESRSKTNGHTWREYIPYTNVLWIGYIFEFLRESFMQGEQESREQRRFRTETRELAGRLKPTPHNLRRFLCATNILEYAVEQGWATEEQLVEYGVDTSMFEEGSD